MKTKTRKFLALLLLGLISLPLIFSAWGSIHTLLQPLPTPEVIFSPYIQESHCDEFQRGDELANIVVDYIRDSEGKIRVSLYPYSHCNANCKLPMTIEETGYYQIRNVGYKFQISDHRFQILSIKFFSDRHWQRLFEEDGTLYAQRTDSSWPFNRKSMICDLSSEFGFYDPIAISGLDGCGIIVLSSDDPGVETEIIAYVPTKKGWSQTQFVLPNGSKMEYVKGYVRRQEDHSTRYSTSVTVGKMELCLKSQEDESYEIYQVVYSEGVLILTPNNSIEITDDILLNWKY